MTFFESGIGFLHGAHAGGGGTPTPTPVPVNITPPEITGTPQAGEELTASGDTWTNSPTSRTYQWKADGSDIGTDADTVTLTDTEVGKLITVTVVAINAGGASAPAVSEAVGPVIPAEGEAPVNIDPPAITGGDPIEGTTRDIFVGTWTDYDTIEVRVITQDDGAVILDWTEVEGDENLDLTGTLGETLIPQARATKDGVTSTAVSGDPYGPVVAGETFIGGWAFNQVSQSLPTSPYTWTNVTVANGVTIQDSGQVYPLDNPNNPALKYGYTGSQINLGTPFAPVTTATDTRLRGRASGNNSMTGVAFRIDLPAGTFRIYGGFKTTGVSAVSQLEIRSGSATGTVLHTVSLVTINPGEVRDIMGNVYSAGPAEADNVAAWVAAGSPGLPGAYKEFTMGSAGSIFIGRSATSGVPSYCNFAILQVA